MNYRPLGATALKVSELDFDCRPVPVDRAVETEFAPDCLRRAQEQSLRRLRENLHPLNDPSFSEEELELTHNTRNSHAYRC